MSYSSSNFLKKLENRIIIASILLTFSVISMIVWGYGNLVLIAIGGLVGLVAFVVFYRRPALGAAFILAFAPLEGLIMLQGISAVKLITLFCTVVLGARFLLAKKAIVIDRIMVLIIVFAGWSLLSFLWSSYPMANVSKWISFVLQMFMFFLLVNLVLSRDDLKLALWGHVVGGVILAIILTDTMIAREFLRKENVAGIGINLASRIAGINLILSMILYQLETRRLAKGILLIAAILSGIGAIIGLSRGTWIGIIVSLVILGMFAILRGEIRFYAGQFFLWSLIGIVLYVVVSNFLLTDNGLSKLTDRTESTITLRDSAGSRFDIWEVGWQLFAESPIYGHGFGTFQTEFASFQGGQQKGAHNAYVLIIVELGLVGIILFLIILGGIFVKLWQPIVKNLTNLEGATWGMVLFGFTIVATAVDSAVDRKYLWYLFSLITLIVHYWGESQLEKSEILQGEKN